MKVSVGITAYNEESNIGVLLEALTRQVERNCSIVEIIVVASGCTDRTVPIVKGYMERCPRVMLIEEAERRGKASAINHFIRAARGDVLIVESADTLPASHTCAGLVRPFSDPGVGMTGAHPVPVNNPHKFNGYAAHFLWRLHHQLALQSPKLGEMIAFRNVVPFIPEKTAVDEASIEALLSEKGLRLVYVPEAIVFNKGPDTISDFLKQRRRITNGHLHLQRTQGYATSTLGPGLIVEVIKKRFFHKLRRLERLSRRRQYKKLRLALAGYCKYALWSLGVVALELYGRLLGYYDFHFAGRNPVAWDIARTTKRLSR